MNEQLRSLIKDYKKTAWPKLLRTDLGEYNLKEIKPYLDFAKNFIDPLVETPDKLSMNQQNHLIELLNQFIYWRNTIQTHTDTRQNQVIVNHIVEFKNWILDTFSSLSLALDIQDKYSSDQVLTKPKEELKKYISARKTIEQELKKIKQTQSQYAEQTVKAEAQFYGDFFNKEANKNKILSIFFGVGLLVGSILTCVIAYCFLRFDQNIQANNFVELLIKGDVINKVFIFSVILLIISVIRREYLALRHQFTLNKHRQNALNSHKEILTSIQKTANESDQEISNAVLLELTRAMFSPQDTGLVKDQKNTTSESKIVEISKSLFSNSKN